MIRRERAKQAKAKRSGAKGDKAGKTPAPKDEVVAERKDIPAQRSRSGVDDPRAPVRPPATLNFTGQNLGGMTFTGVDLHGACLFNAFTFGAIDLDPTGAEIHPFFEVWEGEKVFSVKYYETARDGDPALDVPHDLVVVPGQFVAYLAGSTGEVRVVAPTGAQMRISTDRDLRFHALQKVSEQGFWAFAPGQMVMTEARDLTERPLDENLETRTFGSGLDQAPKCFAPGGQGDLWYSVPGAIHCLRPVVTETGIEYDRDSLSLPKTSHASAMCVVPGMDSTQLCYAAPGLNALVFKEDKAAGGGYRPVLLPDGHHPHRLAADGSGRVWITLPGPGLISSLQPGPGQTPQPVRWPDQRRGRDPRGLALGPDGAMWYTDTAGGRIGRIGEGGVPREVQLPDGLHPEELFAGEDGLYFTLRGKTRFGFIRALERPPTRWFGVTDPGSGPGERKAPGAAPRAADPGRSSWAVPEYRPKPGKPKAMTGAQRRERAYLDRERAERRAAEREAGCDPGLVEGREEKMEAPGTGAGRPDPETRLRWHRVFLAGRIQHVLDGHGCHEHLPKSQFHARHSTEAAMKELLAAAIEKNHHELGYVINGRGQFTVDAVLEGVGWYYDGKRLRETNRFRMVFNRRGRGPEAVFHLDTAYPY